MNENICLWMALRSAPVVVVPLVLMSFNYLLKCQRETENARKKERKKELIRIDKRHLSYFNTRKNFSHSALVDSAVGKLV